MPLAFEIIGWITLRCVVTPFLGIDEAVILELSGNSRHTEWKVIAHHD